MPFSRPQAPTPPTDERLTARMVGIGMVFAAEAERDADIESTLVHASELGMEGGDLRVLAVLTTWLGVHHAHVNADRLVQLVAHHDSGRVRAYWAAIARWLGKDRRFARLSKERSKAEVELLPVGTAFQIARRGEDPRFASSKLRVPAGTLRDRTEDVLSPAALLRMHAGYKNRVRFGPTFRADAWTALEKAPDASVAEIARRASCGFATAWAAARDFRLLREARHTARAARKGGATKTG